MKGEKLFLVVEDSSMRGAPQEREEVRHVAICFSSCPPLVNGLPAMQQCFSLRYKRKRDSQQFETRAMLSPTSQPPPSPSVCPVCPFSVCGKS